MRKWLGIVALGAVGWLTAASVARAEDTITMIDYGGSFQEAESKSMWQPIAKKLGIVLKEDSLQTIADVRVQVQGGKPKWDVLSLPIGECAAAAREGLLEPLDFSVITNAAALPAYMNTKFYTAGTVWASFLIAWSKDKYKAAGPQSWADFFDTKKFPGRRAAYAAPRFMLEGALLADGVPKDKIYPMDLDRAFAKLRSVKKDVAVWYSSFGQASDLMLRDEVDMIVHLSGRIADVIEKGGNWAYTYNQGVINGACTAMVKGAPNKAAGMRFINELIDPVWQAKLVDLVPYGPMVPGVYAPGLINPEKAKTLNSYPDNLKVQLVLDPDWWAENRPAAQTRWDAFMKE
jgi:putative spermidine/putrescine transport system substrate-binding protein